MADKWMLVPMFRSDFGFFDRQRYHFWDWLRHFEDGMKELDKYNSMLRFDQELDRIKQDLFKLDDVSGAAGNETHELVKSPYITDANDERKLALRYDVSKFKPEEVTVKTTDKEIVVHAKHIENSEGRKIQREFTRKFHLPENIDPTTLKATLSKDGVLHVEAPAPPAVLDAPRENLVPIAMEKANEQELGPTE